MRRNKEVVRNVDCAVEFTKREKGTGPSPTRQTTLLSTLVTESGRYFPTVRSVKVQGSQEMPTRQETDVIDVSSSLDVSDILLFEITERSGDRMSTGG